MKKFLLRIIDKDSLRADVLGEIRKVEQQKAEERNYKELANLKESAIKENDKLEQKLKSHYNKKLKKIDRKYRKEIDKLKEDVKKEKRFIRKNEAVYENVKEMESLLHIIIEDFYIEAQAEKLRHSASFQRKGKLLGKLESGKRSLEKISEKKAQIENKNREKV